MINVLHIPKTGGTAIKYAIEQHNLPINIHQSGHNFHLRDYSQNVIIIIRHPWQRFCSGFWERKTMHMRRELSKTNDYTKFGYAEWSPWESDILSKMNTPLDLFKWVVNGNQLQPNSVLAELCAPHTRWCGELSEYQNLEERVVGIIDILDIDGFLQHNFKIQPPQDAFRRRSRSQFDIPQSYWIDPHNMFKFKQWRKSEFELLQYMIKSKRYIGDRNWQPELANRNSVLNVMV